MQRITLSVDDDLVDPSTSTCTGDATAAARRRCVTSCARRGRASGQKRRVAQDGGHCVATLTYVYDHETRELGQRLTQAQHRHHDLQVATLHVHLDHDSCLEVAVLRGPARAVHTLADDTISQRGVRHGHLHLVPAERAGGRHSHGGGPHEHEHIHA